jgi:hypothetical protein
MGQVTSSPGAAYGVTYSPNDYQLAIELTKELEHVLQKEFNAVEGRGLHERVSFVEAQLPPVTVRSIRYLASVRNSLIHERNVRNLQDRAKFIARFESAMDELRIVIDKKNSIAGHNETPGNCLIS